MRRPLWHQGRSVFQDTKFSEEVVDSISIFTDGGGDVGGLGKSQDVDGGVAEGGE